VTQKQIIEHIRQHHPQATDVQIRGWVNQAMDEFCRKTKIITGAVTFSTTADLRWYGLPDNVVEVVSVDFDGYKIPRLVNQPEKRDLT
jgi:hypothetical protein